MTYFGIAPSHARASVPEPHGAPLCQEHCTKEDDAPTCRFCYDRELSGPEGLLVRPCKCKGSLAYVHADCLKKWLQLEYYRGKELEAIKICNLCMTRYNVRMVLTEALENSGVCQCQPSMLDTDRLEVVLQRSARRSTRWRCPLASPRQPIIAGRDPQEVINDFVVLVQDCPVTALISLWKLLAFLAVSVYTITGGFWGIGLVLQFALVRLLPEGFVRGFRAAAPVQQVGPPSSNPILTLVYMAEITLAVAVAAYVGLFFLFFTVVTVPFHSAAFVVSQTWFWGRKAVQGGMSLFKRILGYEGGRTRLALR
eukprot:jgi/Botrbrau1/9356/Bobra.354_2s0013.1